MLIARRQVIFAPTRASWKRQQADFQVKETTFRWVGPIRDEFEATGSILIIGHGPFGHIAPLFRGNPEIGRPNRYFMIGLQGCQFGFPKIAGELFQAGLSMFFHHFPEVIGTGVFNAMPARRGACFAFLVHASIIHLTACHSLAIHGFE
jgi:hypothetical protein